MALQYIECLINYDRQEIERTKPQFRVTVQTSSAIALSTVFNFRLQVVWTGLGGE
jgi:hypothetical protein